MAIQCSLLEVRLESVQPDLFRARLDDIPVTRDQPVKVPSGDDFGIPRHGTAGETQNGPKESAHLSI